MSSRLALNPASLNLVRPELARVIKQAQTEFDNAQAREAGQRDFGACRDLLAQVDGVLRLIELGDAALLAREMGQVLASADLDNPRSAETLTRAFFVLARYLDYLGGRRHPVPELMLEHINALRALRGDSVLGEGHFARFALPPGSHCPVQPAGGEEATEALLRRLRHHFQVGLIGVVKGRTDPVHLRLMQRSLERMCRLCGGGSAGDYWWLYAAVLEGMVQGQLRPTPARARLLGRADRRFREYLNDAQTRTLDVLDAELASELLYLVAKCHGGTRIEQLRALIGDSVAVLPDAQLAEERKLLMGTSVDSVDAMVRVLKGELHQIKDELEKAAAAGEPGAGSLGTIRETLERVAAVLREGGLRSSADTLERQLEKIAAALSGAARLERAELVSIADAVVYVETTLSGLARAQGMARGLREQQHGASGEGVVREALDDARHAALEAARESIEMAKRDVSAFVESAHDVLALAPAVVQLQAVRGVLLVLERTQAASIAGASATTILAAIADGAPLPGPQFAELLADLLICLEYYIAALANGEEPDPVMLRLAEESLATLAPAAATAS